MYKHFLITRFNVKNIDWTTDKNKTSVNDNVWLEDRFCLFDKFCFPSVHSNIIKSEFVWLVFFDLNTPLIFRHKIEEYQILFPQFRPLFIDDMSHLQVAIKQQIAADVDSETKYIITTRVDNDDSLHQDAMKSIHEYVEKNDIKSGLVDLTRGLCMQIEPHFQIILNQIQ
ncbi:glycosyltransferase [Spirosoma utsteinense]|uniref:Uncharacterized protein n=1 Tax=Spirosoma utsteinense TaxID=2585773 RepID=A0ABR6WFP3_9BACT|nr:glycosyltransferase [Spirosoma utsteinense]MBC3795362.1 hypothetical protein [Spirosoma utsteinense]